MPANAVAAAPIASGTSPWAGSRSSRRRPTSSRSRCTAARSRRASARARRSTNRPMPKPVIAPAASPSAARPTSRPAASRSALTPKIEICETAACWTTTVTKPSSTRRRIRRNVHGTWARSVLAPWGLVRIWTASRWRRSTSGSTWTWPVLSRLFWLAFETVPIGIPGGYSDCSGPDLEAGRHHLLADGLLERAGLRQVLEEQLVGVADGRHQHAGVADGVLDLGRHRHRVVGDQRDDRDGRRRPWRSCRPERRRRSPGR